MKVIFHEFGHAFYIAFEPENMEDQNTLVRFGLNASKEKVRFGSSIGQKDGLSLWISISKRKQFVSSIKA